VSYTLIFLIAGSNILSSDASFLHQYFCLKEFNAIFNVTLNSTLSVILQFFNLNKRKKEIGFYRKNANYIISFYVERFNQSKCIRLKYNVK
jgi:hypothetical protein